MLLAAGKSLDAIRNELGHVAEGIEAARAVHAIATRSKSGPIDMPISEAVYRVLYEGIAPRRAVGELLSREPTRE